MGGAIQAALGDAGDDRDQAAGAGNSEMPLLRVTRAPADAPGPRGRWRWRRFLLIPLALALIATGGIIGLYFQPPGVRVAMDLLGIEPGGGTRHPVAVPANRDRNAAAPLASTRDRVVALGRLLPQSDVITIAPPFGAGDARIASIEVEEAQRVGAGDILAILDSAGQLAAAVESARAEVAVLEATLAERKLAMRASREEAEATLGRANAAAENARRELDRAETLAAKGVISEAAADSARVSHTRAERDIEQARATLSRYLAVDIDDQPDVVVAARSVEAARAGLRRAEEEAEAALIRAPIAGTVLTVHALPGERPGEDGILNLGDIDRMMVEVEVYETEIGSIEPGQPVEITAAALPRALSGEVATIGLEVGRQNLVAADPAASTDARVVSVTVALDERSSEIASRFTNLQVVAKIATGDRP